MEIENVKRLVQEAINENNALLPDEKKINITDTVLRDIDSLQLVNLIISIEERVSSEFNREILVSFEETDHYALDSVDSLCNYLLNLIKT